MTERGEAARIGAKLHKNSGRNYVKGDASWHQFVVDFKEYSKSLSLSCAMWSKICMDALRVDRNKDPLLIITLDGSTRLAVLELAVLEDLIERAQINAGND